MKESLINKLVRKTKLFKACDRALIQTESANARLKKENAELLERIPSISQKLARTSIQYKNDTPNRRLRICIEIDPVIIETGFLHGNDETVIEHIGHDIGYRVASEIRKANFQRWEM